MDNSNTEAQEKVLPLTYEISKPLDENILLKVKIEQLQIDIKELGIKLKAVQEAGQRQKEALQPWIEKALNFESKAKKLQNENEELLKKIQPVQIPKLMKKGSNNQLLSTLQSELEVRRQLADELEELWQKSKVNLHLAENRIVSLEYDKSKLASNTEHLQQQLEKEKKDRQIILRQLEEQQQLIEAQENQINQKNLKIEQQYADFDQLRKELTNVRSELEEEVTVQKDRLKYIENFIFKKNCRLIRRDILSRLEKSILKFLSVQMKHINETKSLPQLLTVNFSNILDCWAAAAEKVAAVKEVPLQDISAIITFYKECGNKEANFSEDIIDKLSDQDIESLFIEDREKLEHFSKYFEQADIQRQQKQDLFDNIGKIIRPIICLKSELEKINSQPNQIFEQ